VPITTLLLAGMLEPQNKLLEIARTYITNGTTSDLQASVMFSQMACEASTEIAVTALIIKKGFGLIAEPLDNLIRNYSLENDRLRSLYAALSGDDIQHANFWPDLKKHTKRRNAIVHQGVAVTKPEAEASLAAATALVRHLRARYS